MKIYVNVNTSNDRLRNHKACHGPVTYNKCIITNIRSHSLESSGIFSLNFKSRFITLINPYSSTNFISSHTLRHVDYKSLSLLDETAMNLSQFYWYSEAKDN
jgi:hypothetical protein